MEIRSIIEKDKEDCISCNKSKGGEFVIILIGKKYIAICGKCQKKQSKGWCKNIIGDGASKFVEE